MLKQLAQHRWVCFVQGGLTLLLGVSLLYLRELWSNDISGELLLILGLLTSGFVVLAAALLDLAIAVDVLAREHKLKTSLVWWLMALIGLGVSLGVLLSSAISFRLLALFAAAHAVMMGAMTLSLLPSLRRHAMERQFYVASAIAFLVFASGLLLAFSTGDAPAAKTVGIYAVFFGLQLFYLGAHLPARRRTSLALSPERSKSHAH